jgi:hypothetical protein
MKLVGISSQVSFYVEPTIQTKTSISSTSFYKTTDFERQYDNRFTLNNRFLIFPHNLSPLTLGINAGIITKNKRNIFNFGINGDGTSAGFDYNVNKVDEFGILTIAGGGLYTGKTFTNIHFNYKYRLSEKSKQFNWFVVGGFGVASSGKPRTYTFETGVVELPLSDSVTFLMNSTNTRTSLRNVFMFNLGLQLDVNSPKGKYLFSSAVSYYHSNKALTALNSSIYIFSNSKTERFNSGNYSTGSGIYFQVSRRIQVFPWKTRAKKAV